jgi:hypothetical protein
MRNCKTAFLLAAATLALSSCSKINDMHDATMDMDQRMGRLQDQMRDLDQKTAVLQNNTGDMDVKTTQMSGTMNEMNGTMGSMDGTMGSMNDTMGSMNGTMGVLSDQTTHMAGQTDQLVSLTTQVATLTDKLATLTGQLNNATHDTYKDLRQGNSVTLRADALKKMIAATSEEEKIGFAGIYMQAFEFQLWKDHNPDNQTVLDGLYDQAFIEFFKEEREFQDGSWSVNPTSTDSNMENLYAIAATLHEVNENAAEQDNADRMPQVSILSLIKGALAKAKDLNSGKISWNSLKAYEQEILTNEKDAVYLLRVRENFLPVLVLSQFTCLEYENFLSKLVDFTFGPTPDYKSLNLAQLYTYETYLEDVNTTHDYLAAQGYAPMLDWRLAHLYSGLKTPDPSTLPEPRKSAMNSFVSQITRLQKSLAN